MPNAIRIGFSVVVVLNAIPHPSKLWIRIVVIVVAQHDNESFRKVNGPG
jgi:hypothetical protein